MILHVCNSKLPVASILLLIVATFSLPSLARGQGSAFDLPSNETFGSHSGQILGTVYLNRGGQPASQVLVNIRSLTSGMSRTVLTDFGGHFELREIPSGAYEVSAAEHGQGFASTVTQVNNFPAEVTLYLNSSSAPPRG